MPHSSCFCVPVDVESEWTDLARPGGDRSFASGSAADQMKASTQNDRKEENGKECGQVVSGGIIGDLVTNHLCACDYAPARLVLTAIAIARTARMV